VALACEDEAGPFQTVPYPGSSWEPVGHPARQPHEYARNGTAKLLTLLRPATGEVRVKGVTACPNVVLHAWLKTAVSALLATLPEPVVDADPLAQRAQWTRWQAGLTIKITFPARLPPLRLLLVWDNLTGHHTPELMLWLFARGVMVLFTPLAGSWPAVGSTGPSRSSASWDTARWRGSTPRLRCRSSTGWRQLHGGGMPIRPRSFGAGSAPPDACGRGNADMRCPVPERISLVSFVSVNMASLNASDPLGAITKRRV